MKQTARPSRRQNTQAPKVFDFDSALDKIQNILQVKELPKELEEVLKIQPNTVGKKIAMVLVNNNIKDNNIKWVLGQCRRVAYLFCLVQKLKFGTRKKPSPDFVKRILNIIKYACMEIMSLSKTAPDILLSNGTHAVIVYEFVAACERFVILSEDHNIRTTKPVVVWRYLRKCCFSKIMAPVVKHALSKSIKFHGAPGAEGAATWEEVNACLYMNPDLGACIRKSMVELEDGGLHRPESVAFTREQLGMKTEKHLTLETSSPNYENYPNNLFEENFDFDLLLQGFSDYNDIDQNVLLTNCEKDKDDKVAQEKYQSGLISALNTHPKWRRNDGKTLYSYFRVQKSRLQVLAKKVDVSLPPPLPLHTSFQELMCNESPIN